MPSKPATSYWTISSDHALVASRRGGERAQEGFSFQRAYCTSLLLDLLLRTDGLTRVRWEGVEDIDLLYPGKCSYIQVKHGDLDKRALLESLGRFCEAWRATNGASEFLLVHPKGTRAPRPWPKYVLSIFPPEFLDQVRMATVPDTQELLNATRVQLARRGISSSHLDHAINELTSRLLDVSVEFSDKDVRHALSRFRQTLPPDELLSALANLGLQRLRDSMVAHAAKSPRVERPGLSSAVDQFLVGNKRLLILNGLPGSGKTTLLLETAERHLTSVLTSLNSSDHWSSQIDRDIMELSRGEVTSLVALCRDCTEIGVVILIDQIERSRKPYEVIQQVLSDLAGLPWNVKVVCTIRQGSLPTQSEGRLMQRGDITLETVQELDDAELIRFLSAYHLPDRLPTLVRRVLRTPFAVGLLAQSRAWDKAWTGLAGLMGAYCQQVLDTTTAKDLFLHSVGTAAMRRDSLKSIPVIEILTAAMSEGIPLTLADCDSDNPTSSLRCFMDRGVLMEDADGVKSTHDLWIEFLVARALVNTASREGVDAVVDLLLETDWGVRWSSVPLMAGMMSEVSLSDLVKGVLNRVSMYLESLSAEEREFEVTSSLMLQHMSIKDQPIGWLRHAMELRRAEHTQQPTVLEASRAVEVLSAFFSAQPTVVAECTQALKEDHRAWIGRAMIPYTALDPFVLRLVDPSNIQANRFVIWLEWLYLVGSIGVICSGEDAEGPITIRAFEGPRLPTVFKRQTMDGMHLLNQFAYKYFPTVLPDLLAFANHEDRHIQGYLEVIADFSAVAVATHADPGATWRQIVAEIPTACLGAAGWILASTYPHVPPNVLLVPAMEHVMKNPSSYEAVRKFSFAVVTSAMVYCLLDLPGLSTEALLLKFAEAIAVWEADITVDATKVVEVHLEELVSLTERFAVLCLVFLAFHAKHASTPDEPAVFRDMVQAQIDSVRALLHAMVEREYPGFDVRTEDASRLPLSMVSWLRASGRLEEAEDFERVGTVHRRLCDRLFGIPQEMGQ